MQRGPQRRTGALDRAQRRRGRGQQVADSGWQGRRYASREAAGEAQFQVGGADSRAGGSGAGLRARIAGLVEGQVRCKPIGAAARVRAGQEEVDRRRYQYLNDSPVGCALRSAASCNVHVRLRYGTATLRLRAAVGQTRHSESSGRAAAGQSGRGHLTTMERGRNGTVQLRQRGVWEREVWWTATGRSF